MAQSAVRYAPYGEGILDHDTGEVLTVADFNARSTPFEKDQLGRDLTAASRMTNQEGEGGSTLMAMADEGNSDATEDPSPVRASPQSSQAAPSAPSAENPSLEQFLEAARQDNPGVSDRAIKRYWAEHYGEIDARSLPTLEEFIPAAKEDNPGVSDRAIKAYWREQYGDFGAREKTPPERDFMRGAETAVKQIPQLAYGLEAGAGAVGEKIFGEGGMSTAIKEHGVKKFNEASKGIEKESRPSDSATTAWEMAKEGNLGALVDFIQYGLGYIAVQGVEMVATGGVGYAIGKLGAQGAAKVFAGKLIAKEAAKIASGQAVTEAITKQAVANVAGKIGQTTALAASAIGMEGGEIFGDLTSDAQKEGRTLSGEELAKAFGATVAAGSLEFVGDKIGFDLIMGKGIGRMADEATGLKGRAARGLIQGTAGAAVEGGTEFGQTLIEAAGKGKDPFSEASIREAVDSAALGTVGGTAIGAGSGALRGAQPPEPPKDEADIAKTITGASSVDDAIAKANAILKSAPVAESAVDAMRSLRGRPESAIGPDFATGSEMGGYVPSTTNILPTSPLRALESAGAPAGSAIDRITAPAPIDPETQRAVRTAADLEAQEASLLEAQTPPAQLAEPLAPERTKQPFEPPILPVTQRYEVLGTGANGDFTPAIQPGQVPTPRQAPELTLRERLAQERERLVAMRQGAAQPVPAPEPNQPVAGPIPAVDRVLPSQIDKAYPSVESLVQTATEKGFNVESPTFQEVVKAITKKTVLSDLTPVERQKLSDKLQSLKPAEPKAPAEPYVRQEKPAEFAAPATEPLVKQPRSTLPPHAAAPSREKMADALPSTEGRTTTPDGEAAIPPRKAATPYSDLVRASEAGVKARHVLRDLPESLRRDVTGFAASGLPANLKAVEKWLASKGTIGYVKPLAKNILKYQKDAIAVQVEHGAIRELNASHGEKKAAVQAEQAKLQTKKAKPKSQAPIIPSPIIGTGKGTPSPAYTALPATTREKFEAAFAGAAKGDRPSMRTLKEWLYGHNKTLRAEFERRTGVKLPKGLAATNAAVEAYFAKPSPASAKSEVSTADVTQTDAEKATAEQIKTDAPINPKVQALVAALNKADIATLLSGDAYGDKYVYVDLASLNGLRTDALPHGWQLTLRSMPHMEHDLLGTPLSKGHADQTGNLERAGQRLRLARKGAEPVTASEAAGLVNALKARPDDKADAFSLTAQETPKAKAKGAEQLSIEVPPTQVAGQPIIGREVDTATASTEAPLFSKAAQEPEAEQTALREEPDDQALTGRAKDDAEEYLPILERQVSRETSPQKKALAAVSVLNGLHPQAQQALTDHLKAFDPAAYQALHERNLSKPESAIGKTTSLDSASSPRKEPWEMTEAQYERREQGAERVGQDTLKTKETEQGTALFSRGSAAGPFLSRLDMERVAARIDAGQATPIHVRPYESLPEPIRQGAERMGDPSEFKAVLWHGDIYLIADRFTSEKDLEEAIFHELYHKWVAGFLGGTMQSDLNTIFAKLGGKEAVLKLADKYKWKEARSILNSYAARTDLTKTEQIASVVNELLAEAGARNHPMVQWKIKEFIGAVREWLRKHGFLELANVTESDLAYLLKQARKASAQHENGAPYFQSIPGAVPAPTFYSHAERVLESKMPNRANFEQIKSILLNSGVKADEQKWIGLDDYLKTKDYHSKADVLAFVRENQVQVQEVMNRQGAGQGDWAVYDGEENTYFSTQQEANEYAKERGINITEDTVFLASNGRGDTKFHSYQLHGGTDYRELLLTLPEKEPSFELDDYIDTLNEKYGQTELSQNYFVPAWAVNTLTPEERDKLDGLRRSHKSQRDSQRFTSSHFSEPNILAHVRFNTRTADGKKVLFLEEVQSDWHQTGRRKGYRERALTQDEKGRYNNLLRKYLKPFTDITESERAELASLDALRAAAERSIPDAPFKKTWHELALKRMVRYAAENGYDELAWTTGDQQAERYDLSKQVDSIEWNALGLKTPTTRVTVNLSSGDYIQVNVDPSGKVIDGESNRHARGLEGKPLSEVVGKEIAEKIMASYKGELKGEGLKVGGEGMKGFYDQILPAYLNKYGKKWGATVRDAVLSVPTMRRTNEYDGAGGLIERKIGNESVTIHALPITEAMRDSVVMDGQPLFQRAQQPSPAPRQSIIIGDAGRKYTPEQRQAMERTGSMVTPKTIQATVKDLWKDAGKKLAQGLVDQFRPVRDLSESAYGLLRLSKSTTGAFEAFMHHGKLSLKDGAYDADTTGGVIESVFVPLGRESTDFLRWIAGNRAERLMSEGKEHLFTDDDIAAFKSLADDVTDFDYTLSNGTVTRDRTLIYKDALTKFNAFNKNVLDMAEQSGLIDGASRHLWEHEFYVPFYRTEEDADVRGMNIKSGAVRQEAFKRLKGGDQPLNDLLANTLMNWAHLIDASAKNRAAKATLDAAENVGIAHPATAGDRKTVWYMGTQNGVHGKLEYTVSDPYVLEAINSVAYAGLKGPAMDALSAMKHWLTVGVTASPFFKVRNLIRDSVQAIGTSGVSYNPVKNIKKGIALTDRSTQEYVSALAGGGLIRFGTMLEGNEATRVRQLIKQGSTDAHILDGEGKLRAFYDKYVEPAISAYNELGNRGEEINRMTLYDTLIKQGKSHAHASLMARDLLDFSMHGTWQSIRFLTQVVPFMNARLQGLYKLGRAAHEDPARFAWVLGAVTLASLGLLAAYSDDDDWKKREAWDRDNFWWFRFGGEAFRIPKPFEIGAIATLAERSAELIADKEMTGKRFMESIAGLTSNQLAMNPIPQAFKPIIDLYANHDSFTDRPIETMGMERLDPAQRYRQSTSLVARGLSTAGNALTGDHFPSPVQIDHVTHAYFGWLGSFAVGSADFIVRGASDEPTRPALDYWKVATGGMVSDVEGAHSRYVSQLYEQAKELERAHATWRHLLKEGKSEEAQAYREDHRDELTRYRRVEHVKKQATKLNERIRMIERSTLSREQKRDQINAIHAKQDAVARQLAPQ